MTLPLLVVAGVIASAYTKLHAVILGRPVTVPVLMLAAVILILALAVTLAMVVRAILRDGLRLYPEPGS